LYLPSIAYYRRLLEQGSFELVSTEDAPNRTVIRGAWGEQTLTVPIEGGRRRLLHTPADLLMLSEHGNWRHTHWQAITSAYGALPYFHYLADPFEEIYARPAGSLTDLCTSLHEVFLAQTSLRECVDWLAANPSTLPRPADVSLFPSHIAAIELLFARGPESVFYLLAR